ncbi:hypothetical protein ZOSMA_88G00270 [Zostera marina]|uniref:Uncharacterized protein n=1 Tax=Zostera marina TaxID=29655 RepID=A0A0K9NKC0_ZOSMR|nr:hypothetical protein ZOSMA_88G00270 [Zostera marina]
MAAPVLPPWLSHSYNSTNTSDPSVTLSLSSSTIPPPPPPSSAQGSSWLVQQERADTTTVASVDGVMVTEITDCCRELEEGYQAWMTNKKETTWRLQRVELQLESGRRKRVKRKWRR